MEDRESKMQSLDEYLGERGLSFPVSDFMLDKTRIPHGLTSRAKKRMHREADIARNDYSKRRIAAINEYNALEVRMKYKVYGNYVFSKNDKNPLTELVV